MNRLETKLAQVKMVESRLGGFAWDLGRMYGELREIFRREHPGRVDCGVRAGIRAARLTGEVAANSLWDAYCIKNLRKRAMWINGMILASQKISKEQYQRLGVTKAVMLGRTAVEGKAFSEIIAHALQPRTSRCMLQVMIARAEEEQGLRRPVKSSSEVHFQENLYETILRKVGKLDPRQREELARAVLRSLSTAVQCELGVELLSVKVRKKKVQKNLVRAA